MAIPEFAAEWLETDRRGGFASGTVGGPRTRRYHALLLVATAPPGGRVVLVNGLEAWVDTADGPVALSSQHYLPDVTHPDGMTRLVAFSHEPWPAWTYLLPDGSRVRHELLLAPGSGQALLWWRREGGAGPCRLRVRLLLSGRDYHALHHENPAFRFEAEPRDGGVTWRPYADLPPVTAWGGAYAADAVWHRNFLYAAERDRGLDYVEDLASPGILSWDLAAGDATLVLRADTLPPQPVAGLVQKEQARRMALPHRAAHSYLAARGAGQTVIAGFPWFTDWGRDTFIALRGLLLATGQRDAAQSILLAWSAFVSQGMLPNRFPDGDQPPEYNAVDASLWFIVAVHELIGHGIPPEAGVRLQAACLAILEGYAAGTRFGIGLDADGLLRAGAPGQQLTWMDAKVGDWVVTPRAGKPVEVQALWINALAVAGGWAGGARWAALEANARAAFLCRFPDPATGGLYDVVDVDGVPGTVDRRVRPNQILAVGGLPYQVVPQAVARGIVGLMEQRLLTPLGLRTLDPADPGYRPRYQGSVLERDAAYHQGTAWPWLLGPFVEAWLRVGAGTREQARARFLSPLRAHLGVAGLGHVSEVVDGDPPHTPGGCPFQAWSLGELLRIEAMLAAP